MKTYMKALVLTSVIIISSYSMAVAQPDDLDDERSDLAITSSPGTSIQRNLSNNSLAFHTPPSSPSTLTRKFHFEEPACFRSISALNVETYHRSLEAPLDASHVDFLKKKRLIIDAAALGAGCSLLFWMRNHLTLHRFPPIGALTTATALLSAGKSLAAPAFIVGSGAFIWHELKEKVRLEEKVKKYQKDIETRDERIERLTLDLETSKDTLKQTIYNLSERQHQKFAGLKALLEPMTHHTTGDKHNKHCREMSESIRDQVIPMINSAVTDLDNVDSALPPTHIHETKLQKLGNMFRRKGHSHVCVKTDPENKSKRSCEIS